MRHWESTSWKGLVAMRRLMTMLLLLIVVGGTAAAEEIRIDGIPLTDLIRDLCSHEEIAFLSALSVISTAGPAAAPAVPALTELLDSDDATIRGNAANALACIGEAATPAVPKLRQLAADDPDPTVRLYAGVALDIIATPAQPDGAATGEGGTSGTLTTPEPSLPTADPGVTAFLQPLRDHRMRLTDLRIRIGAIAPEQPADNAEARRWAQGLTSAGNDLLSEARSFRSTLHAFINSRTRHGLTEEIELIEECVQLTSGSISEIVKRIEFDLDEWVIGRQLHQEMVAARTEVLTMLAREIDHRLETEGLVVLLATEGIAALKNETLARLRSGVESELDRITQRELGLAFHDAASFRSAVRGRAQEMLRRQVSRLLIRLTGNEIVVELLGTPIVSWIENDLWPKLREAFREKGNLEFRTERSANSLERARMILWELAPDARLDQVQAALRGAAGALNATRYLVSDLNRANRGDLLAEIRTAGEELDRAMSITRQRFLLHKLEALESVKPQEEVYRALIAMLEAVLREIHIPDEVMAAQDTEAPPTAVTDEPAPPEGTPREPVERIEFGPLYLVHLTLTHTMYGPLERDVWTLSPGKPDAEGTLLIADDMGGYYINKVDQCKGPFTSNYQLAPVLVGLGLRSISYGRLTIRADPEIWGGGN